MGLIGAGLQQPRVCSSCLRTINRSIPQYRRYAATATAVKASDRSNYSQATEPKKIPAASSLPEYIVQSGVLLSRPPILTKEPSSFEKAFFFYQKRLNERLVMPFTRYFYFKKDTPADTDWKIKAKERDYQPARELGGYNPYSDVGWNDELLVGDKLSETSTMVEALVRDSHVRAVEGKDGKAMVVEGGEQELHEGKIEMPLERTTEADRKHDVKRLDRQLERTLYLVVKKPEGSWEFPHGPLEGRENLLQAAERVLVQTAGVNMNTWLVGHAPVGAYVAPPVYEAKLIKNEEANAADVSPKKPGRKVFFMKGRIMAGQANLKGNIFGFTDFKWLTKEEIQKTVSEKYFSDVKDMLADR
ncbi:putative 54S ribosomal protein L17, mitochondrial [Bisporella sp. PMI_857]|nr:putative 54S ribosomal protein L17, mitochondrial [Bisporella sp. PMI_857]